MGNCGGILPREHGHNPNHPHGGPPGQRRKHSSDGGRPGSGDSHGRGGGRGHGSGHGNKRN